ncbi:MAG: hypothetical protein KatS3mg051_0747 [Anaerolineae bacterium]|nr:MAG: hypothetical protein KatS3mg051_0747 [Anaerolineae bacterium]
MARPITSHRASSLAPRPVESEWGAAFPEPCAWPLTGYGEALYSRPINPSSATRTDCERSNPTSPQPPLAGR